MSIYHFISDENSTPANPAGKFREALEKLIDHISNQDSNIYDSLAIRQFRELHNRAHFPGLGKVKQISMQHHIELITDFLARV